MGTKVSNSLLNETKNLQTLNGNQITGSSIVTPATGQPAAQNKNGTLGILGRTVGVLPSSIAKGLTSSLDNISDVDETISNYFAQKKLEKNPYSSAVQLKAKEAAAKYQEAKDTHLLGDKVKEWEQSVDERQQAIATDNPNSKLAEYGYKATELGESLGAMLPTIAASAATSGIAGAVTGGASLVAGSAAAATAAKVAQGVGLAAMWGNVYSQSTKQATDEGNDFVVSAKKGFLDATLEVATEMMFSGIAGLGEGYMTKTTEKLGKAVNNLSESGAAEVLKKASGLQKAGLALADAAVKFTKVAESHEWLGEALEEMTSEALSPFIERWTTNPDAEPATIGEIIEAGIGGAIMSVAMKPFGKISANITEKSESKATQRFLTTDADAQINLAKQWAFDGVDAVSAKAIDTNTGSRTELQAKAETVLRKRFGKKTTQTKTVEGFRYKSNQDAASRIIQDAIDAGKTPQALSSMWNQLSDLWAKEANERADQATARTFNTEVRRQMVEQDANVQKVQNQIAKAQEAYNEALAKSNSLTIEQAQANYDDAKAALDEAQKVYDSFESKRSNAAKDAAANLQAAKDALLQADIDLDNAKMAGSSVREAEAKVKSLQGELTQAQKKASQMVEKRLARDNAVDKYGQEAVDAFEAYQRYEQNSTNRIVAKDASGTYQTYNKTQWAKHLEETDAQYQKLKTEEAKSNYVDKAFEAYQEQITKELNDFAKSINQNYKGKSKLTVKVGKTGSAAASYADGVITLSPEAITSQMAAEYYMSHELLHFMKDRVMSNTQLADLYSGLAQTMQALGYDYDTWYNSIVTNQAYHREWAQQLGMKIEQFNEALQNKDAKVLKYVQSIAQEETMARFISTAFTSQEILQCIALENPALLSEMQQSLQTSGVGKMRNTQWDYARLKTLEAIANAAATPTDVETNKEALKQAEKKAKGEETQVTKSAYPNIWGDLTEELNRLNEENNYEEGRNDAGTDGESSGSNVGRVAGISGRYREWSGQAISNNRLFTAKGQQVLDKDHWIYKAEEFCDSHNLLHTAIPERGTGGFLKKAIACCMGNRILFNSDFSTQELYEEGRTPEAIAVHEWTHMLLKSKQPAYMALIEDMIRSPKKYFNTESFEYMDTLKYFAAYTRNQDPRNRDRISLDPKEPGGIQPHEYPSILDELLAHISGHELCPIGQELLEGPYSETFLDLDSVLSKLREIREGFTPINYDLLTPQSEFFSYKTGEFVTFDELSKANRFIVARMDGRVLNAYPNIFGGRLWGPAERYLHRAAYNLSAVKSSQSLWAEDSIDQFEDYQNLSEKYGTFENGTPQRLNANVANSQTADRLLGDERITDPFKKRMMESMLQGVYSHLIITDADARTKARQDISAHTNLGDAYIEAMNRFEKKTVRSSGGKLFSWIPAVDKYDLAYAEQLIVDMADRVKAIEEGTDIRQNESSDPTELYDQMEKLIATVCTAGTRAGQNLQAFALLKKLTPTGRLYYIEKEAQAYLSELVDRNGQSRVGGYKVLKDKQGNILKEIKISDELRAEMEACTTQEEMDAVEEKIIQEIANQIPPSVQDRIVAWRYLAMLGNPRTHIRNMVSNYAMGTAVKAKDAVAGRLEDIFLKDRGNIGRTKTVDIDPELKKSLMDFADADWDRDSVADTTLSGGKVGFQTRIDQARNKLGFGEFTFLDKASKWNMDWLEKEDAMSAKRAYKNAFVQYCAANGLTAEYLSKNTMPSNTRLAQARSYAVNEAAKATYHDASALASALNQIENMNSVSKLIVGGLVPFKKTPINILKRGLEYSPIGIVKGVKDFLSAKNLDPTTAQIMGSDGKLHGLGEYSATSNADALNISKAEYRYNAEQTKTKMMADALDRLASGLTGTGIMLLGMFLGHLGLMKGAGDENDREEYYDQMLGNQEYSITIGGNNYTLDWLTPVSMPLFTGVQLMEMIDGDGSLSFNEALDAVGRLADPVMNLSVLQGINDAMSSYDSGLGKVALSAVEGYVSQFIPTLSGQIARTIDPTRRTTYAAKEGEGLGKDIETFRNKLENKIPGLSQKNSAYIDMRGNTETSTDPFLLRLFENAVAPYYKKEVSKTPTDDYISRLFQQTGDRSVIPTSPQSTVTVNGEKYYLKSDEYQAEKTMVGQLSYNAIDSLLTTPGFFDLSAEDQAGLVSKTYSFSNQVAKMDYSNANNLGYAPDSSTQRILKAAAAGVPIGTAIYIDHVANGFTADKDENGKSISGSKKAKVLAFYQSLGLTEAQIKAISIYDYE